MLTRYKWGIQLGDNDKLVNLLRFDYSTVEHGTIDLGANSSSPTFGMTIGVGSLERLETKIVTSEKMEAKWEVMLSLLANT